MFLCDSNVWLALALSQHPHHTPSRRWLDDVEGLASVLFCRATQLSLLRLLTNAAVFAPYGLSPLTNTQAWGRYREFVADPRVALRSDEPAGIVRHWAGFALRGTAAPKLWMDAYLAAFAFTAGYRMVTTDHAFRQFPDLDLEVLG